MEVGDRLYTPQEVRGHSMGYIYCLIDPRDWSVFYVGKSENPCFRYGQHCRGKSGSNPVELYRQELADVGLVPIFEVLAKCRAEDAAAVEKSFIHAAILSGERLVNSHHHGRKHIKKFTDIFALP